MAEAGCYHKGDLHSQYGCRRNCKVSSTVSLLNTECEHNSNSAHGVRVVSNRTYHVYQKKFSDMDQLKCVKIFNHTDESSPMEDMNANICADDKSREEYKIKKEEIPSNDFQGSIISDIHKGQTTTDNVFPEDDGSTHVVDKYEANLDGCGDGEGAGVQTQQNSTEMVDKHCDASSVEQENNLSSGQFHCHKIFYNPRDDLFVPITSRSKKEDQTSGLQLDSVGCCQNEFVNDKGSSKVDNDTGSSEEKRHSTSPPNSLLLQNYSIKMSGSNSAFGIAGGDNTSRVHETKKHGMGHLRYDKTPLPSSTPPDWPI